MNEREQAKIGLALLAYEIKAKIINSTYQPIKAKLSRLMEGLMMMHIASTSSTTDGRFKEIQEGMKHIFGCSTQQKLDAAKALVEYEKMLAAGAAARAKARANEELKAQITEVIGEGNTSHLLAIRTLIQNQIDYMKMDRIGRGTEANAFDKIFTDVKFMATLLKSNMYMKLVGVQPMNGPVSLAYRMVPKYKTDDAGELTKEMRGFEIVARAVQAGTRRLQGRFNVENPSSMSADMEETIRDIIGLCVAGEMDTMMVTRLLELAHREEDIEVDMTEIMQQMIPLHVMRAATAIAQRTKRGPGNWVLTTPMVVTFLQMSGQFVSVDNLVSNGAGICHVGTFNGTIQVYTNVGFCGEDGDTVLVGYKDPDGELDSGIIVCPYVPIMSSGVVVSPQTFEPQVSLMTRYGIDEIENASDYYACFKVKFEILDKEEPKKEILLG